MMGAHWKAGSNVSTRGSRLKANVPDGPVSKNGEAEGKLKQEDAGNSSPYVVQPCLLL